MTKVIEVVPYNSRWPKLFEKEAFLIKQTLGENCIDVHHIGSTSVPSLSAKPIIDIIVVIKEPLDVIENLEKLGYIYKGEYNIPFRLYFNKKVGTTVHLHVYEQGNPEIELNLLFRDFLRTTPTARQEYTDLKLNLMAYQALHYPNNSILNGYTLGKDPFIKKTLEQAEFQSLCIRVCAHYDEWKAARLFRQKYFFDPILIKDPYTWTFEHKDHVHFIFYQGTKIIGYAHLQLWPQAQAAIRAIVIIESRRNRGIGSYFLSLCERWLYRQGFKVVHIQSSLKALPFYSKHGYIEMPFNNPEAYKKNFQDIEIGKFLQTES